VETEGVDDGMVGEPLLGVTPVTLREAGDEGHVTVSLDCIPKQFDEGEGTGVDDCGEVLSHINEDVGDGTGVGECAGDEATELEESESEDCSEDESA